MSWIERNSIRTNQPLLTTFLREYAPLANDPFVNIYGALGYLFSVHFQNFPILLSVSLKYGLSLYHLQFLFSGDMSVCRWGADTAAIGPHVYVCGGSDNSSRLNTAERYDPFHNVWIPITPMNSCRNGVGIVSLGGRVYAIGR